MTTNSTEIVYVDSGTIAKQPTLAERRASYIRDSDADRLFPFRKTNGKRYFFTPEFKEFFGDTGGQPVTLTGINLCPAVNLWIGLGANHIEQRKDFDICFAAESTAQLHEVADYYGLNYPIGFDVGQQLDSSPQVISYWNAGGLPVVPACIRFENSVPVALRLYTYPKPFGTWDVWMYGASFYDHGKCYEKGAIYQKYTGGIDLPGVHMRDSMSFRKAEMVRTENKDGVEAVYRYVDNGDPAMFWHREELDYLGRTVRIKKFESSLQVQSAIINKRSGFDFSQRSVCPVVEYWLGRSWYENQDEEEFFFAVTGGVPMLDAVALFYNLPVPYGTEQQDILETNPTLYRARSYDLLGLGDGNYISVVVASIQFKKGIPERLLLYTFLRPWEFEEPIVLPDF